MLLQAAGNAAYLTRTCFAENFRHEGGHGCSTKWSKNHQHGRCTHNNAHFACGYRNRLTFLCKTHAHRHALCHRMEAHRIPAGLHQARKHSIGQQVSIAAVKSSSNQDTSQQGEASKEAPSIVYTSAVLSAKYVGLDGGLEDKAEIVNGNANLKPAHLSTTDTVSSEEVYSEDFGSSQPTKQFTGGIKGLKNWWKTLHEVYQKDTAIWGYGSSPIFTVYEGPDGKIEKVLINEKEIQRRQGMEPYLPGFGDDESNAQAKQKILLAESIAKDLEMGKISVNTNSTIFTVIKHPSKAQSQSGRKKLLTQIDFAVHKAAPILRSVFMIAIPLYGISILIGAYLLVTKRSEEDITKEEESAANLEKMRKLKAQMSTRKNTADVGQATLAPSDFMQKLLEVREMARQVRSEEGLQKLAKDSGTVVEDYQPQQESVPKTSMLIVGNEVGTEQGGIGHEDVIDTVVNDSSVPTMHNVGVIKSNNNVIDVTVKPPPKVKPRLITSLDEAMAVLGDNQTVMRNGVKSSLAFNGTAERALIERGSQGEHESGIASNNSVSATINGLSNLVTETMPSKVDEILDTSLERQAKIGETQSIQSSEIETPQSGVSLRPDKGDTGILDGLALEGRAIEAETLEHGSEELKDSDETSASRLIGENLQNGLVKETQILSSVRPNEVINPAQNPKNTSFRPSKTFLKNYSASKSVLNVDTDEVVGSGQPLRRREARTSSSGPMANTKRWSKELQRKYDSEKDPETRELMKEIGSELDSWVTEEEVEEVSRLASKLEEGDDEDVVRKHYENLQKKVKQEKEKFGLETVLEKYKEYQPKREDELWWLDLRCVLVNARPRPTLVAPSSSRYSSEGLLSFFVPHVFERSYMGRSLFNNLFASTIADKCLMVLSAKEDGRGLYGLDMSIDSESTSDQLARHIIAFADRKDASNFCRLLELRSDSRFQFAEVCPFSPKKLYEASKEEGFKVTVLKAGQIQTNIDQTLEEVEEQIVEIGRRVYWEKIERENSIDMDSILHQRFGL